MERILISHFSFSTSWQTQLWATHRHIWAGTHTHKKKKHTRTSFADPNERVKWLPASPYSTIFYQQTGSHFKCLPLTSLRNSGRHCTAIYAKLQWGIHFTDWREQNMSWIKTDFQEIGSGFQAGSFNNPLALAVLWGQTDEGQGQTDQSRFLKGTRLTAAGSFNCTLTDPSHDNGNYLSISNVLMSLWCERQSNQGLLVKKWLSILMIPSIGRIAQEDPGCVWACVTISWATVFSENATQLPYVCILQEVVVDFKRNSAWLWRDGTLCRAWN